MKQYGLIGYPLSHSFSKKYFTEKFEREHIEDTTYHLFPIEKADELPTLLQAQPDLCGLNVTVPHKMNVLQYLDWIADDAKNAGAVNCIRISGTKLEGFNTDIYGFENSLKPLLKPQYSEALILGDGGAAQAVKCVLDKLGIAFKSVTRKAAQRHILFSELTSAHINQYKLIINTTPIGMSPKVDDCPTIPYEAITDEHLLYDLIYNPEETLFLAKGKEKGAMIKNGYEMLVLQAERSWEIWNSR